MSCALLQYTLCMLSFHMRYIIVCQAYNGYVTNIKHTSSLLLAPNRDRLGALLPTAISLAWSASSNDDGRDKGLPWLTRYIFTRVFFSESILSTCMNRFRTCRTVRGIIATGALELYSCRWVVAFIVVVAWAARQMACERHSLLNRPRYLYL